MLITFERLSAEKKNAILTAAAGVFAEEGYHYARVSRICEKASISNGALYKYFSSKETLFNAVIDYTANLVNKRIYEKSFSDNESSLFAAVRKLLQEMVVFNNENRVFISIYSYLGSSSMNRFAQAASVTFRAATSLHTLRMVEKAKARGEIRESIKNEVAACAIDNYITLFSLTLVCEYHKSRFDSFFSAGTMGLSDEERIKRIISSLKDFLCD